MRAIRYGVKIFNKIINYERNVIVKCLNGRFKYFNAPKCFRSDVCLRFWHRNFSIVFKRSNCNGSNGIVFISKRKRNVKNTLIRQHTINLTYILIGDKFVLFSNWILLGHFDYCHTKRCICSSYLISIFFLFTYQNGNKILNCIYFSTEYNIQRI